jgi:hypothetical protein
MQIVLPTSSLRFALRASAISFVIATRLATRLAAQAPTTPDTADYNYCLGFAFSSWTPPLDLKAAGHNPIDTAHFVHAPGGRDWAASGTRAEGDTSIVLFPIWWPAGVVIALDHMPKSIADTVHGKATALVADGRKSSPTSAIRAWEKRCS